MCKFTKHVYPLLLRGEKMQFSLYIYAKLCQYLQSLHVRALTDCSSSTSLVLHGTYLVVYIVL